MLRRTFLAGLFVLATTTAAQAIPHGVYDIYVYNTSTMKVVRMPRFHLKMHPGRTTIRNYMLIEKKKAGANEAVGYHFEGTYNVGDTWKGGLKEINPLPVSTPIDLKWAPPPTFGGGDFDEPAPGLGASVGGVF